MNLPQEEKQHERRELGVKGDLKGWGWGLRLTESREKSGQETDGCAGDGVGLTDH